MAAADAQTVLASPEAFEALVTQLLQADNVSRKHAEAVFEEVKKHPDGCVSHLMRCLRQSPSEEHRAFSAIMLRKVLTRDEPTMYAASSPQVQVSRAAGPSVRPAAGSRRCATSSPLCCVWQRAAVGWLRFACRMHSAPPMQLDSEPESHPDPFACACTTFNQPHAPAARPDQRGRQDSHPSHRRTRQPPTTHHPPPPDHHPRRRARTQATVKQELLGALAAEPNASVRKKVGDTVSELASDLLAKEQWPEVLPALVERVQSGQPQVRGCMALLLLGLGLVGARTHHVCVCAQG